MTARPVSEAVRSFVEAIPQGDRPPVDAVLSMATRADDAIGAAQALIERVYPPAHSRGDAESLIAEGKASDLVHKLALALHPFAPDGTRAPKGDWVPSALVLREDERTVTLSAITQEALFQSALGVFLARRASGVYPSPDDDLNKVFRGGPPVRPAVSWGETMNLPYGMERSALLREHHHYSQDMAERAKHMEEASIAATIFQTMDGGKAWEYLQYRSKEKYEGVELVPLLSSYPTVGPNR